MARSACWLLFLAACSHAWVAFSVAAEPAAADLRLNQVQVVATHNSYHLRPASPTGKVTPEFDYSRQPLDQQLDQGVRSFELDLHVAGDQWRVMHVPLIDSLTTVPTFVQALEIIQRWSAAHPRHVPISLLLELKEEGFKLSKAYREPQLADLERLDANIRQVFSDKLITPDTVRGSHSTLFDAVRAGAWPKLTDCAGKVLVIMHEQGPHRAAYLDGHPALEGRAMFVESALGEPHSAVLIRNNPREPQIPELVRQGYLVRTRVDSQGDVRDAKRSAGLASGAHLLTTDYPAGEIAPDRAFSLPNQAPARVNPITGPEALRDTAISEPIGP